MKLENSCEFQNFFLMSLIYFIVVYVRCYISFSLCALGRIQKSKARSTKEQFQDAVRFRREPCMKQSKTDHDENSPLSNNVIDLAKSKHPIILSYKTILVPLAFNEDTNVIYILQNQWWKGEKAAHSYFPLFCSGGFQIKNDFFFFFKRWRALVHSKITIRGRTSLLMTPNWEEW